MKWHPVFIAQHATALVAGNVSTNGTAFPVKEQNIANLKIL
jgi:hypothetical protein